MTVTKVIQNMTAIQDRLRELASDVENLQISFDGQTSPNSPPKMEHTIPGNLIGAMLAQEEYTDRLIGHLQSKINFLANSLYPNSQGQALSTAAATAMAQKLAPRSPTKAPDGSYIPALDIAPPGGRHVDNNGKHL